MSAEQRVIMPSTEPVERTRIFQDEWAVRYGILMGGTAVIETPGIGQFWIGHSQIVRRQLMGFTHQQVRGRNEAEDGKYLDEPGGALLGASPLESAKFTDKSPALCMREAIQMLGGRGFVNSQTLMGDTKNADRLFSVVLPAEIASLPLVEVISFLEQSAYVDNAFMDDDLRRRAHRLRENDLLPGAYIAREYMTQYTNAISEEIGNDKKTGKKKVDSVDIQYFWELKLTLPKDKPLEATTMLGREIAGAMSRSNDNSEMVIEMREANRLKAEELEIRRLELGLVRAGIQPFICECAKEFDSAQGLAMHKTRWCDLKQSVTE